ncbi:glycosyltransferase [Allokutzneria albata]|uniref:UDP:flavonoid glycosyltransferase YjiC, YdhE family n=1 Tax=Allokutzneria albata TaxID=211114 RepID=A0A1G9SNI8_ALLAB|nr:glycosyltransferase [Allokutzneria albata]SDM36981.1 UDP:flavonoid glycosyltransferase YjiC, YdhE family [Allokutzneria albata]
MRVLIVAVGTMGDVAPYTGLVPRLVEAGHEVAIAAYPRFAELIRSCGAEFRDIPGDPAARGEWTQAENSSQAARGAASKGLELGEAILAAAKQGTDVLLLSMAAQPGVHVAESLGIPSIGVFLQPLFPTTEHPPSFLGVGGSLGGWGNRAAARAVMGVMGRLMSRTTMELRSRLGLPTRTRAQLAEQHAAWPVLHGYSPSVLPRPADWRPGLEVCGYFWPAPRPEWTPPQELLDFLADGPPPVFVGFGSRKIADAPRIAGLVDEALRLAGVRGVIQAGWADLTTSSSNTITIGEAPHEWLFPQVSAVVHHSGAGTTAAGLRAGVPTVGVPILGDQPFWAGRVAGLGAGPTPVPYKKLTARRLADAIASAPAFADRARELGRRIATEDGAGAVVAAVNRLALAGS